jgi:hypothetical protein
MILSVDGGRSRIYSSGTSQGARHRCFLVLMVDTPGSPALTPPGGASSIFFSVGGGCSRIYSCDTSQGGPLSMFLCVDGGRSQIYNSGTSQGAHH